MPHTLPDLPYPIDALEPYIDSKTMQIHHDLHHGGYVSKLNAALENYGDLQDKDPESLVSGLDSLPEEIWTAVRNNGGGHVNHSMFWEIMAPNAGGNPSGTLLDAINHTFGSVESFRYLFEQTALGRFGSGWAWLVFTADGNLSINSTANQDSPLMSGEKPVLGLDVWEHAYYLNYQNRRADYVKAWWNVVNWEKISERFNRFMA